MRVEFDEYSHGACSSRFASDTMLPPIVPPAFVMPVEQMVVLGIGVLVVIAFLAGMSHASRASRRASSRSQSPEAVNETPEPLAAEATTPPQSTKRKLESRHEPDIETHRASTTFLKATPEPVVDQASTSPLSLQLDEPDRVRAESREKERLPLAGIEQEIEEKPTSRIVLEPIELDRKTGRITSAERPSTSPSPGDAIPCATATPAARIEIRPVSHEVDTQEGGSSSTTLVEPPEVADPIAIPSWSVRSPSEPTSPAVPRPTLSGSQPLTIPTPTPTATRWLGKQEVCELDRFKIREPLLYFSPGLCKLGEPSCLQAHLAVDGIVPNQTERLPHHPNYAELSPRQRAFYLAWLATGRTQALKDIGYALLFFEGMERRVLIENQDLSPVVKEVVRLLDTYTFSESFDGILGRFLSYSLARVGIGSLKEKWFQAVFERTRVLHDEQHLAVGLAWLHAWKRPLPVSWALRIARLDARSPRSVVVERVATEFQDLFTKRYQKIYDRGMTLQVADQPREISYRPFNPSLLWSVGSGTVRVPNVTGLPGQFTTLVEIWASCIDDLKKLSRVRDRDRGGATLTRQTYDALPDELKAQEEHPDQAHWDRLAADNLSEDGTVMVQVKQLAALERIAARPKLTAKQSLILAGTAEAVGFAIEPDFRITNRLYGWDDWVILFRTEEDRTLPTDSRYAETALLLEIGMFIAAADGEIHAHEVDQIITYLESQFLLDSIDSRRLDALKRIFLKEPPSIRSVGLRLKSRLSQEQRESVGEFLVGVAASHGAIDRREIQALRTAYRTLDVDEAKLTGLLDQFRSSGHEPVEVAVGVESASVSELIPSRSPAETPVAGPSTIPKAQPAGLALNPRVLESLMRETDKARQFVGDWQADQAGLTDSSTRFETIRVGSEPESLGSPRRFTGLDARHGCLLEAIGTRESWTWSEYVDLVKHHRLMPDGALDVVNEWAYDSIDDPLMERVGDRLVVRRYVLESLE